MTQPDETPVESAESTRSSVGQSIGFLKGSTATPSPLSARNPRGIPPTESDHDDSPTGRVVEVQPDRYVVDPVTGCWIWRGWKRRGYGIVRVSGRPHSAHVVVYEQLQGAVPDGLVLDHLCRNRACVNPDHLEPVTIAENNRRGLVTKIDPAAAREITERVAAGESTRSIAKSFGIHASQVSRISRRKAVA